MRSHFNITYDLFIFISISSHSILQATNECPMCSEQVEVNRLEQIQDLQSFVNENNS